MKRKTTTKEDLKEEIRQLEDRITELECSHDVTANRVAVVNEVMAVLNELPIGRALISRAVNRSKLRYLQHVVIPRRQKRLLELQEDESIPEPIREVLEDDEIALLEKASRHLHHRRSYEKESARRVRDAFMRLQRFLTERFTTKKITAKTKHLTKGEEDA